MNIDFKHYFLNGGRIQLATGLITLLIAIFVIGGAVNDCRNHSGDIEILKNDSPQKVLNEKGPDGIPVVKSGDILLVAAVKCNLTKNPVTVNGRSYWVKQDDRTTILFLSIDGAIRNAGCLTPTYRNHVPNLSPGIWRLEGVDTPIDVHGFPEGWYTENFRVIE